MKLNFLTSRTVEIINVVFSTLLATIIATPYLPIGFMAFLGFLSLIAPVIVFINLLFVIYWLIFKKSLFIISSVVLIVGYFSFGTFYKFSFENNKTFVDNDLKIMTFNSKNLSGYGPIKGSLEIEKKIVDFILKEDPDIICFQEYNYLALKKNVFKNYKYKHYDSNFYKNDKVFQIIISKYPIVSSDVLVFPNSSNGSISADIKVNKDTIRVYNVHLESYNVRPKSLSNENSNKLLGRLYHSMLKQEQQANIIKEHYAKFDNSVVICGDFNSTQFSKPYMYIKGDFKDSFEEKGSGYGKTINFWRFPLRIDFILSDPKFEVVEHKNYQIRLSDHEPVMASFKLSSDE